MKNLPKHTQHRLIKNLKEFVKVFFILSAIVLLSCSKKMDFNTSASENGFLLKNSSYNVLTFDSDSSFYATLVAMVNESDSSLDAWESARGFRSMRRIINEIVDAELLIASQYENMTEMELEAAAAKPLVISEIAEQYEHFIIKRSTNDGGEYFDWNIHDYRFTKLLNRDAIVLINGQLVQHSDEYVKIILDGDLGKISLLAQKEETDSLNQIVVVKRRGVNSFSNMCEGDSQNGKYKVLTYEEFIQSDPNWEGIVATTYRVKVRSLQKRFWGLWYDNVRSQLGVGGNSIGTLANGWTSSGNWTSWNYTDNYSFPDVQNKHTWEWGLPSPNWIVHDSFGTEADHPEIESSNHVGTMTKSGQNAYCQTEHP